MRGSGGIGNALAAIRKAKGMTQDDLARALGVDRMTTARMEAGKNRTLDRITKAFSLLGYDLVAVPRGSRIDVREDGSSPGSSADPRSS